MGAGHRGGMSSDDGGSSQRGREDDAEGAGERAASGSGSLRWSASRDDALRAAFTGARGLTTLAGLAPVEALARASRSAAFDGGLATYGVVARGALSEIAAAVEVAAGVGGDPLALVVAARAVAPPRPSFAPAPSAAATAVWLTAVAERLAQLELLQPPEGGSQEVRTVKLARVAAAAVGVVTALGRRTTPTAAGAGGGGSSDGGDDEDGYLSESEQSDGDAALRWLVALLRRVAYARLNSDALAAGAAADWETAAGAAAAAAGLPFATAPAGGVDTPVLPTTPAQARWLTESCVQHVLREAGGGPGDGPEHGWWRLPAAVPPGALLAVASALESAATGPAGDSGSI